MSYPFVSALFVVIGTYDDSAQTCDVFGPFHSHKEAADWIANTHDLDQCLSAFIKMIHEASD